MNKITKIPYIEFLKDVKVKRVVNTTKQLFYYIANYKTMEERLDMNYDKYLDNFDEIEYIDQFARTQLVNTIMRKINNKKKETTL
jgi:hypothetical protein